MEIYVTISFFLYFLHFSGFNHDYVTYIILPMLQLQTQKLMTSKIRPHIECLIQTYNILVLILYSNVATLAVFNTI